jgi:uncharacterized membrane protein
VPIPHERTPSARWTSLALLALTLGVAAWRLRVLAAEDLWFDEVFSAVLASQGPGELLRRALGDETNPPGFYLALLVWTRLGTFDTAWLRALPALAAIATIPTVAWTAQQLGMRRGTALVAALLAASSPLLLAMGGEVRAYAPLAWSTALLLGLAWRVASAPEPPSRGALVALAMANLAAGTLHYFGALAVLSTVIATAWLAPARARQAIVAAMPAGVLVGGWVLAVALAAGDGPVGTNADWISAPGVGALPSFASQVIGGFSTSWGAWSVLVALVASLVVAARGSSTPARWLLVSAVSPLVAVALGGLLTGRSLWVARYLIIVLPPLWLLLADAATGLARRRRLVAVTSLLAWASLAGPLAELSRTAKPSWSLVVRALAGNRPVRVCVNESFVGLPLRYYAISEGLGLDAQDLAMCTSVRDASLLLTRPGTESSVSALERAGATIGPPRSLGTRLPDLDRRAIRWRVR